jgi:hypothetical protein
MTCDHDWRRSPEGGVCDRCGAGLVRLPGDRTVYREPSQTVGDLREYWSTGLGREPLVTPGWLRGHYVG